jgi:hypothetical protein
VAALTVELRCIAETSLRLLGVGIIRVSQCVSMCLDCDLEDPWVICPGRHGKQCRIVVRILSKSEVTCCHLRPTQYSRDFMPISVVNFHLFSLLVDFRRILKQMNGRRFLQRLQTMLDSHQVNLPDDSWRTNGPPHSTSVPSTNNEEAAELELQKIHGGRRLEQIVNRIVHSVA